MSNLQDQNANLALIPTGKQSNSDDSSSEYAIPPADKKRKVEERWVVVDMKRNKCAHCDIEQPIRTKVIFPEIFNPIF